MVITTILGVQQGEYSLMVADKGILWNTKKGKLKKNNINIIFISILNIYYILCVYYKNNILISAL